MWSRLTESAQWAMWEADQAARNAGEKEVTPRHFLLGILSELDELRVPLSQAGVDFDRLQAVANLAPAEGEPARGSLAIDSIANEIIDLAATEATTQGMDSIDVGHFFVATLTIRSDFREAALGPESDLQVVRAAVVDAVKQGKGDR